MLTLYTQLAFDSIGYGWTFIIMGFMATAGAVLSYFHPQNISSEDFRKRFGKKEEVRAIECSTNI